MNSFRDKLKDKKRIVIKIGSSSLTHEKTGELNLFKIEKLIRVICDLKGEGKDVVLVSSGAIAAGRQALGGQKRPQTISEKQAYAAVGQARLMMVYQRIFSEYNHIAAQVLLTKDTMTNDNSRMNAQNTFEELLRLGATVLIAGTLMDDEAGRQAGVPCFGPRARWQASLEACAARLYRLGRRLVDLFRPPSLPCAAGSAPGTRASTRLAPGAGVAC